MLAIVADVETTGFSNAHVVTQIASAALDLDQRLIVGQGFLQVQLTEEEIAGAVKEALDTQGWTKEANDGGTPREQALEQYREWCSRYPADWMVAHNASFDRRMMVGGQWCDGGQWACTMKGLKRYRNLHQVDLGANNLATLAQLCGYEQKNAHNALDDVFACANGLFYLTANGVSLEDMRL